MMSRKSTLGRGLADLLGQTRPLAPAAAEADGATALAEPPPRGPAPERLERLPVEWLQRGRYQPRLDLRPESLAELAESIRAQGVVQPIVVRPVGERDAHGIQRYEIIAGERRWRAAQQAGLAEIPAVVRAVADEAALAMALIENIQRENLNPLEEARALQRLIAEFGLTHQDAAQVIGRSRAAVSNLLRLLELPEEVCAQLERRELEMGHARALLGLPQRRAQIEVALLVARKGLSVRETEALVRRMAGPARAAANGASTNGATAAPGAAAPGPTGARAAGVDPNIRTLETELSETLGAPVQIEHARAGGGRIVIRYHSLDELDGILGHLRPVS